MGLERLERSNGPRMDSNGVERSKKHFRMTRVVFLDLKMDLEKEIKFVFWCRPKS